MMQYQQQPSLAQTPTRKSLQHRILRVCFPVFIAITVLVAFPSFIIGGCIWWCSLFAWDRREYWRTTIAVAVFGVIGYGAWISFVDDPLPWLVITLFTDLLSHLWWQSGQTVEVLWVFNLWLAPATAPVLAVLYPGKKDKWPFEKPAVPKVSTPDEARQEEQDLEIKALIAFERMTATLPGSAAEQMDLARAAGLSSSTIVVPSATQVQDEALGVYEGGELETLVSQGELCLPPDLLELHGVVVGVPKSGKTTTLLRLATIARSYGRKVVFLDLKGSRKTAALFLAAMSSRSEERRVGNECILRS